MTGSSHGPGPAGAAGEAPAARAAPAAPAVPAGSVRTPLPVRLLGRRPAQPGPPGVDHPPVDRVVGRGARNPAAEGPEVVLAEERVGCRRHRPQVERVGHLPGQAGQQGVGHRGVDHQVAVATGDGRVAGVEPGRGDLRLPHDDGRGQLAVARLDHRLGVEAGRDLGREVEVDHLVEGVDAGVGASGTGEGDRGAGDPAQCLAEGPGHRELALLGRETMESRPVVGDLQPPPDGAVIHPPGSGGRAHTSSMRAIGALSPRRLPSLRMRV